MIYSRQEDCMSESAAMMSADADEFKNNLRLICQHHTQRLRSDYPESQ